MDKNKDTSTSKKKTLQILVIKTYSFSMIHASDSKIAQTTDKKKQNMDNVFTNYLFTGNNDTVIYILQIWIITPNQNNNKNQI